MKKTKSGIIVPDEGVITPGKVKKIKAVESISMMLTIPFTFNSGENMGQIIDRLDGVIASERVKTIDAIGKLLGIKINWEEK